MSPLTRHRIVMLCGAVVASLLSIWTFFGPGPLSFGLSASVLLQDMIAPAIQGDRKLGIPLTHTGDSHAKQSQIDPSTAYTANFTFGEETLGIASNIYVLSLPHRMDRRMSMERLRQTLGLQWTYINAIDSEADTTRNIYAHIRDRRARVEEGVVTGLLDDTFEWPNATSVDTLALSASPLGLSDSDYWSLRPPSNGVDNSGTALLTESDLDDSAASAGYPQLLVASSDAEVQHDPLPSLPPLTCASKDYVTGPPFELGLPGYMLLTPAKVSCWYSHLEIIRKVADGHTTEKAAFREPREHAEDVSLILEDDVDMEHDIHARLRQVWPLLPAQWDIVFLGHCWSNESYYPAIQDVNADQLDFTVSRTTLHPSFAPKCTHAYALTRTGARRLLLYLRHTPFAYSRALDQAISWLILSGKLKAFSVVPSVAVQRKIGRSDIDTSGVGMGSMWRDRLENGVLGN